MLTKDEAEARVAKGAAHLDRVRPGWADQIDVMTFAVYDRCGCIIGQLEGDAVWAEPRIVGLAPYAIVTHGFDVTETDPDERGSFARLQDAWIAAIAARRVSTGVDTMMVRS